MKKVAVVTVTYSSRWNYISQVIDSVIRDEHLEQLIIVDNASKDADSIEAAAKKYEGRITVLREQVNTGSAGGFARGLAHARSLSVDYVLMLDDDNVPEPGALKSFIETIETFDGKSVVLLGNRVDIAAEESVFTKEPYPDSKPLKTFFNVFDASKISQYMFRFFGIQRKKKPVAYLPIVPSRGFVYGGAFLPVDAVRKAPLPDASLVLYGDDVEYSWGVLDAGYMSYICDRPIIRDVDMSFEGGDHILGLFNKKTQPFKVYFRLRNMVRISRRNSMQTSFALFTSICVWILGLFMLGILKYGITANVIKRMKLILQAVYSGYTGQTKIPQGAELP